MRQTFYDKFSPRKTRRGNAATLRLATGKNAHLEGIAMQLALLIFNICADVLTYEVGVADAEPEAEQIGFSSLYSHKVQRVTHTVRALQRTLAVQSRVFTKQLNAVFDQQHANTRKVYVLSRQLAAMKQILRHEDAI